MADNVTYHPEADRSVVLQVLSENADGTVDIGLDGQVIVSRCEVHDLPKVGAATPIAGNSAASDDTSLESKKVYELRDIADSLGIDHAGLKKAELIEAIIVAQTDSQTEV